MTSQSPQAPLVTVAIPAYNRPQAVCEAVESACKQNVERLEVLVVDDVSKDGAWEVVQQFARDIAPRYPHARLRLVRNDRNMGLFGNFNRCLELAEGEFVRILCNDDRLAPDCLRYECALMQQHPNVSLLSARGWFIDAHGQRTKTLGDILPPGIYKGHDMVAAALWILAGSGCSVFSYPSGVLMRRDAVRKAGWFEVGMKHLGDMDYFLRVAQQGDMAITLHDGCEISQHEDAVTSTLLADGHFTEEWFMMADKWAAYLPSPQQHQQLVRQCAMYSFFLGAHCWRRKQKPAARAYWQAARMGRLSPLAWLPALTNFLRVRSLRRSGQMSTRLIQPFAALNSPQAQP